ncbi:TetR/AcrR family transcriptional regulator [Bacillus kwashiorkori]|uniref:TetR/AcrR family transcriptional regulator n=1 Tax=Bacillus kwashiorkori TaxID=1522318 RepID=UPI00078316B5|nr:TetR/AcrR family transcriptional regulator [Bacillus kwashiorkori]
MVVDRKTQIVEAAEKSFSMFGYKATTMDQIAKLANVGKGTIYTFFKNKEELLRFIMTNLIKEMKVAAEETFDAKLSFHENVHRAIYKMLEYRLQHKLAIKLFEEEKFGTPEVVDALKEFENAIVGFIRKILEEAIAKGHIVNCDTKITAFIIVKIYVALIFEWEKNNPSLTKEELANLLDLYIFKGLS